MRLSLNIEIREYLWFAQSSHFSCSLRFPF